jgi:hypothetical protein
MKLKYKVGDKLKKIGGICVNYDRTPESHHIVITQVVGEYCYDIMDKNGKKLDNCWSCLTDKDLVPYKSSKRSEQAKKQLRVNGKFAKKVFSDKDIKQAADYVTKKYIDLENLKVGDKVIIHCRTQAEYDEIKKMFNLDVVTYLYKDIFSDVHDSINLDNNINTSSFVWYKVDQRFKDYTFLEASEVLSPTHKFVASNGSEISFDTTEDKEKLRGAQTSRLQVEVERKKKYVISSRTFDTLEQAKAQIEEWDREGTLRPLHIYEVSETYDVEKVVSYEIKKA